MTPGRLAFLFDLFAHKFCIIVAFSAYLHVRDSLSIRVLHCATITRAHAYFLLLAGNSSLETVIYGFVTLGRTFIDDRMRRLLHEVL